MALVRVTLSFTFTVVFLLNIAGRKRKLATDLVDPSRPGCANQALMELGALICTPQNPQCSDCPVSSFCFARRQQSVAQGEQKISSHDDGLPLSNGEEEAIQPPLESCPYCADDQLVGTQNLTVCDYPRLEKKKQSRKETVSVTLVTCISRGEAAKAQHEDQLQSLLLELDSQNVATKKKLSLFKQILMLSQPFRRHLIVQRPDQGLLASMWEFPSMITEDGSDPSVSRECVIEKLGIPAEQILLREPLGSCNHLFTHINQTLNVEWLVLKSDAFLLGESYSDRLSRPTRWVKDSELSDAAVSKGVLKCLGLAQKWQSAPVSPSPRSSQSIRSFFASQQTTNSQSYDTKPLL